MGWILKLLDFVIGIFDWVHDQGQQEVGAQKQVIADDAKTVEIQQKELRVEADRPTDAALSDELRTDRF